MVMEKIKLYTFTINKIKNNEFENSIPEFYELRNIVENNDWHDNDPVFNHVLFVSEKLGEVLENVKDEISTYLGQKITNYTRKDILFLASLFHDIAKKETIVKDNDVTTCQNHEEVGSIKVKKILDRFDLSEKEKAVVVKIVKNHGVIHHMLDSTILDPKGTNPDEEYQKFKSNYPEIFLELILLAMADTLGSQLVDNKPDEFNVRMSFYKRSLEKY
jgi:hypothetical protein